MFKKNCTKNKAANFFCHKNWMQYKKIIKLPNEPFLEIYGTFVGVILTN